MARKNTLFEVDVWKVTMHLRKINYLNAKTIRGFIEYGIGYRLSR